MGVDTQEQRIRVDRPASGLGTHDEENAVRQRHAVMKADIAVRLYKDAMIAQRAVRPQPDENGAMFGVTDDEHTAVARRHDCLHVVAARVIDPFLPQHGAIAGEFDDDHRAGMRTDRM